MPKIATLHGWTEAQKEKEKIPEVFGRKEKKVIFIAEAVS